MSLDLINIFSHHGKERIFAPLRERVTSEKLLTFETVKIILDSMMARYENQDIGTRKPHPEKKVPQFLKTKIQQEKNSSNLSSNKQMRKKPVETMSVIHNKSEKMFKKKIECSSQLLKKHSSVFRKN